MRNTKKLLAILPIALFARMVSISPTYAYGKAEYQVAFSGNCNNKALCGGQSGFWGWCSFGPSGAPATSGTDSDCQSTNYFHSTASSFPTIHTSIMGTAWDVEAGFTGAPDFFITAGSFTVSGPAVVQDLATGFPFPPALLISLGCSISGKTVTCPIDGATEAVGLYNPDTGIVFFVDHFQITDCSAFGLAPEPGCHYMQQVNQIP